MHASLKLVVVSSPSRGAIQILLLKVSGLLDQAINQLV